MGRPRNRRSKRKPTPRARKRAAARASPKRAATPRRRKPLAKPKALVPVLPEIAGYVRSLPPPVKIIVNTLRRIVREAAPEARELLDGNSPAYEANGLFARIEASDRAVLLEFLRGDHLDAPDGLLQPGPGAERHIALSSLKQVKNSVLRALVRQAVLLNLEKPGEDPTA